MIKLSLRDKRMGSKHNFESQRKRWTSGLHSRAAPSHCDFSLICLGTAASPARRLTLGNPRYLLRGTVACKRLGDAYTRMLFLLRYAPRRYRSLAGLVTKKHN